MAKRRGYIGDDEFGEIYQLCTEILLMINSLRRSLNSKIKLDNNKIPDI
jgi:hypothetical protein